ncbi:L,D-transpeptidase [Actinomadura craniellae]|uniref:L,D-transpeptidase n=1 Tax=Actinomadura craniellae TaxID=2231787 RepID=UPI001F27A70A|nr:Ig-like domain-containing protein [Actinomadura craniellae]
MQRRFAAGTLRGVRATAGLTGAALLLATACSGGGGGTKGDSGVTVGGTEDAAAPHVTITPGDGNTKARPDQGVVIKAANGTLDQVSVLAGQRAVTGEMSADRTTWKSRTLVPGVAYVVSVTAKNAQKSTTATSKFRTLRAANPLSVIDVTPMAGETVGVGMPITVTFNRTVTDRKAVERALTIKSTKPAVGAWYWVSGQQVIFRTKNGQYWQPNQQVALSAKLAGVKAGKDVYGTRDVNRKFKIGDSHISTISTKTKKMVVKVNGRVRKTTGISAGKGGRVVNGVDTYLTTNGVHLTMSKHRVEIMTSEWMGVDPEDKENGGYKEVIPFAVRISSSGEYVHAMGSRMWAMGQVNASHGCVNSPPVFAQWFYNLSYRGDVVVVTGSKRQLAWNNGWSYYQMPWTQWVRGSALKQEVSTG